MIEEANKIAPAFGRIFKEMILIVDPELPMVRTPKGTVQRKETIKAYEAKINSLYVLFHFYILPFLNSTLDQGMTTWNLLIRPRVSQPYRFHGRLKVCWPGWCRMRVQLVRGVA